MRSCVICLFIVLLYAVARAEPEVVIPSNTFDKFQQQVRNEAENSVKKKVLQRFSKSSQLSIQSTFFESPWSVDTVVSSNPIESDKSIPYSLPSDFNAKFQNRDGDIFSASISLFKPDPTNYSHIIPGQGLITYGKDITKGGRRSPMFIQAEIDRSSARSTQLAAETQFVTDMLDLHALATKYFNDFCRIQDLELIRKGLEEIMVAVRVKASARTIGIRDVLTLQDALNKLNGKIVDLMGERNSDGIKFSNYGPLMLKVVTDLLGEGARCIDPTAIQVSLDQVPPKDNVEFARGLPNVVRAQVLKESEQKTVELLKVNEKMSFVPYFGTAFYSDQPIQYNRIEGVIGFHLIYQFPGPDKTYQIRAHTETMAALASVEKQAESDTARDFAELFQTIRRGADYLSSVIKSLETSRKLLDVIKLQLALGLLDPAVTSQAFLSYAESLESARDIWEKTNTAKLQIQELQKSRGRLAGTNYLEPSVIQ